MHIIIGLLSLFVCQSPGSLQQPDNPANPFNPIDWGSTKIIDGSMDEWSPLGAPGGHGTKDNEYYIYDAGEDSWNDPQGGMFDEPLSLSVVVDHPISGNPEPVASGFNLWGVYLCYEPFIEGRSAVVALDLPLASNTDISPDYWHAYNDLPPLFKRFYPVAFDADGNGDPKTVNSEDEFPGGSNGINYIKSVPWFYDDGDLEIYKVILCFGDDDFPVLGEDVRSIPYIGLPVVIDIESTSGIIKTPTAIIPGKFTRSGADLDLMATYGTDVLEVGGHDAPDPMSSPRIVDIEIRIKRLAMLIKDPNYIDWGKVKGGKFSVEDLRKIFVMVKSGSFDDLSDEHYVYGGSVFPDLPLKKALSEMGP